MSGTSNTIPSSYRGRKVPGLLFQHHSLLRTTDGKFSFQHHSFQSRTPFQHHSFRYDATFPTPLLPVQPFFAEPRRRALPTPFLLRVRFAGYTDRLNLPVQGTLPTPFLLRVRFALARVPRWRVRFQHHSFSSARNTVLSSLPTPFLPFDLGNERSDGFQHHSFTPIA
ncbi:hypothetical protein LCGC14_1058600 [marine sediment metagenome]|uniref:Uncharacterized protein n=1 Tax=marine sediment metagenome TaxID=412755 RepID=A0A0F9Q4L9_9ZZZZ